MISKRLEKYRTEKGLKVIEFARLIGISHGSLSEIKHGKSAPRADTLEKIVQNTDINPIWLLTGKGSMTRNRDRDEEPSVPPKIIRFHHPEIDDDLISAFVEIMTSDDEGTKQALKQNVFTFQRAVRNEKIIREAQESPQHSQDHNDQTDFKLQKH